VGNCGHALPNRRIRLILRTRLNFLYLGACPKFLLNNSGARKTNLPRASSLYPQQGFPPRVLADPFTIGRVETSIITVNLCQNSVLDLFVSTRGLSVFLDAWALKELVKRDPVRRQESPKIAILTSASCGDIFRFLDCAAGAQSRSNQFGRRKGLKTCDLQSTIAWRSPFIGIRKDTVFRDSSAEAILRMRRVCCRIR
jgi:hypothetical protein